MEEYDVVIVGGGIAGSVAAKFISEKGFKTLLLERFKTPRNKACSGIQFNYFEKLIGEKIPREKLCSNELNKVKIVSPNDKVLTGKMQMLNFWRSTFDHWLNTLAVKAGVEFKDETTFIDYKKEEKGFNVKISVKKREKEIKTRYLIGADGMLSKIRRRLQPHSFAQSYGTAINYYFQGDSNLNPNTLYMFFKKEFCPIMFAWVYLKDDKWAIGTGANQNIMDYIERFYTHVKTRYNLRGKIVKKEGFASTQKIEAYLGDGNILLVGDAAGLIDLYRGVGMDTAALSGRLAVKAILKAEEQNTTAINHYKQFMENIIQKLESNAQKQEIRYTSNDTIEKSLSSLSLLKTALYMTFANQINKVLPPEKIILLPV